MEVWLLLIHVNYMGMRYRGVPEDRPAVYATAEKCQAQRGPLTRAVRNAGYDSSVAVVRCEQRKIEGGGNVELGQGKPAAHP